MATPLDSQIDQFLWIIKNGIRKHVKEVNQLLPLVTKRIRPDQFLEVPLENGLTRKTLLHILTVDSKIEYQLLFQDNQQQIVNYDILDGNGWTPLSHACCFNNDKAVRILLEHKSNPNFGLQSTSPITQLIYCDMDVAKVKILKLLLQYGADVNIGINCTQPLHEFLYKYAKLFQTEDQISFLKELINGGANVNHLYTWSTNVLHTVCIYHNMVFAQILLEAGCDHNQKDSYGQLPIDKIRAEIVKKQFSEMIENLTLR